jgi:hypothetical protein
MCDNQHRNKINISWNNTHRNTYSNNQNHVDEIFKHQGLNVLGFQKNPIKHPQQKEIIDTKYMFS